MRIGIITDYVDEGFAGTKTVIEDFVKNLIQLDKKQIFSHSQPKE